MIKTCPFKSGENRDIECSGKVCALWMTMLDIDEMEITTCVIRMIAVHLADIRRLLDDN